MTPDLTFLLDVDNTLLDNDALKRDLGGAIERRVGPGRATRFWDLYEEVRRERDYVDFPETVRRLAAETGDPAVAHELTELLYTWPFQSYLYPHALDTISYLKQLGTVAILSDGDSVFQPLKIRGSGLFDAVDGHVLIYIHKEENLPEVLQRFPADHYVMVDDKARIASALERLCPADFTTILVLQGKYARDRGVMPAPDYVIENIGDLRRFTRQQFLAPPRASERGAV